MLTLKEFLVTVIIPSVHSGCEKVQKIHSAPCVTKILLCVSTDKLYLHLVTTDNQV